MKTLKYAMAIGVAGVLAIAAVSPSQARGGHVAGAVAGGFIAGAAIGAAAATANNGYYYGSGYYDEPSYAYEPAPGYSSGYYYDSPYGQHYNSNMHNGPNRERQLTTPNAN